MFDSIAQHLTFPPFTGKKPFKWGQFIAIPLLFTLMMSLISACGPATPKIHLTLWYWNRSIDDKLIAQVDKVFPNVVLNAVKINDYDNKVRTAMAGHSGIPDILGINSNIATYFPDENQFVDLRTLGANSIKSEYLPWKWSLGVAPDGKVIGVPTDAGPIGLFYRADLFAKAGLPTDPAQVSALMPTWNAYLQEAAKYKNATHGKSYMVDSANNVYTLALSQSTEQFLTPSGQYIANEQYMKNIWTITSKAAQTGVDAKVAPYSTAWNQAVSSGYVAAFVGAAWMKQILQDATPNTAGDWRIAAAPGGPGNNGGSFLAVTTASKHPQEAYDVAKWLESPQNQLFAYKDIQLFPSTIWALNNPTMNQNDAYYGGENTNAIFAAAAKNIPTSYKSPYDTDITTDFTDQADLMDYRGKSPTQAWNAAQQASQRELLR
ncbi:MAG TPA: extracellular solute-binding protein [Dictyobacter sp.]|jgi:cellobiose transport system substrate-binding protein|nr:extracellular solute-binding protein [Dictyobacter sp.]